MFPLLSAHRMAVHFARLFWFSLHCQIQIFMMITFHCEFQLQCHLISRCSCSHLLANKRLLKRCSHFDSTMFFAIRSAFRIRLANERIFLFNCSMCIISLRKTFTTQNIGATALRMMFLFYENNQMGFGAMVEHRTENNIILQGY